MCVIPVNVVPARNMKTDAIFASYRPPYPLLASKLSNSALCRTLSCFSHLAAMFHPSTAGEMTGTVNVMISQHC